MIPGFQEHERYRIRFCRCLPAYFMIAAALLATAMINLPGNTVAKLDIGLSETGVPEFVFVQNMVGHSSICAENQFRRLVRHTSVCRAGDYSRESFVLIAGLFSQTLFSISSSYWYHSYSCESGSKGGHSVRGSDYTTSFF